MKQYLIAAMLLTSVCSFLSKTACGQRKQGRARLDSLIALVPGMNEDTAGVKLYGSISAGYMNIDPDEGLKWSEKEMALARKLRWRRGEGYSYNNFGNHYRAKGAYPEALDAFFNALRIAEANGDKAGIGSISGNIGTVYGRQADYVSALRYHAYALRIAEERGDKRAAASATGNIGNVYSWQKDYPKALEASRKALELYESLKDKRGTIIQSGNMGGAYADMRQYNTALVWQMKALRIAEEIGQATSSARLFTNIGRTYYDIAADTTAEPVADSLVPAKRAKNLAKAIEYMERGLTLAKSTGQQDHARVALENLSQAYEHEGSSKAAFAAYKESIAIRDSIFNTENDARLIRSEEGYKFSRRADSLRWEADKRALAIQKETALTALAAEYARKQAAAKTARERQQLLFEEDLKRQRIKADFQRQEAEGEATYVRRVVATRAAEEKRAVLAAQEIKRQKAVGLVAGGVGVAMLLVAVIAFRAFRQRRAANIVIAAERERSEALLRNILPAEVAEELKASGGAEARQFDEVSVLFTDFVDYTGYTKKLSPTALVQELHECFTAFDAIIEKHGLEKIKTIGDVYMAVGGLPNPSPRHAYHCVQAAIEIRDFMLHRRTKPHFPPTPVFDIRIGINSGPVVAGIVGVKKFAYDIWGDTVNTAARMEAAGEAGKINISQSTFELVKDEYRCSARGIIVAKGKGEMAMYFVEQKVGRKSYAKTAAA